MPSCRLRGLAAPLMMPKFWWPTFAFGDPNCGVLVKLNASNRNCAEYFSPNWKLLNAEKSHCARPGRRRTPFPASPNASGWFRVKAAGFHHPLGSWFGRFTSWPGTTSARSTLFKSLMLDLLEPCEVGVAGVPPVKVMMEPIDHPPSSVLLAPVAPFRNGSS